MFVRRKTTIDRNLHSVPTKFSIFSSVAEHPEESEESGVARVTEMRDFIVRRRTVQTGSQNRPFLPGNTPQLSVFSVYRLETVRRAASGLLIEWGHLVNRFVPSDSLDREWESHRTGCHRAARPSFSIVRTTERERKSSMILATRFPRDSSRSSGGHRRGGKRGKETREQRVWKASSTWKCLSFDHY